MMLGEMIFDERMFGRDSRYTTCINTDTSFNLEEALSEAVSHLEAEIGYYEQAKKRTVTTYLLILSTRIIVMPLLMKSSITVKILL